MNIRTKTFFASPLLFVLIVLAFLKPDSLNYILPAIVVRGISYAERGFSLLVIGLCLLDTIDHYKNGIGDVIAFFIFKIAGTLLVSYLLWHILGGAGIFTHIQKLAAVWYVAISMRYSFRSTVCCMAYLLCILVAINLLTILLFPHGMYHDTDNWECWFLGYDNGHMVVLMPALYFSWLDARHRKRRLVMGITWFSVYASALICRSATTLAGLAALAGILVLIYVPAIRKFLFNWKTVLAVILAVFFFIVVLRRQEMFQDVLMRYFGKDTTFTGRIYLWDAALDAFKKHPWFGTGDSSAINADLFTVGQQKLAYAHNEILDLLVRSGIIGLMLYMVCVLRSLTMHISNKTVKEYKVWLAFMASWWLSMMFESYSNYALYWLYFVVMVCPRFEEKMRTRQRWMIGLQQYGQKNS